MKQYWLQFGNGDPSTTTGLAPTFLIFRSFSGVAITAPGITQPVGGQGLYKFEYAPTFSIVFVADGATTSLSGSARYITGVLDPVQAVDEKIGDTSSSFGSTSVDPTTVMGYLKRNQEFSEGNATFNKQTGIWDVYSRGSSTMLAEKTLTNSTNSATKT